MGKSKTIEEMRNELVAKMQAGELSPEAFSKELDKLLKSQATRLTRKAQEREKVFQEKISEANSRIDALQERVMEATQSEEETDGCCSCGDRVAEATAELLDWLLERTTFATFQRADGTTLTTVAVVDEKRGLPCTVDEVHDAIASACFGKKYNLGLAKISIMYEEFDAHLSEADMYRMISDLGYKLATGEWDINKVFGACTGFLTLDTSKDCSLWTNCPVDLAAQVSKCAEALKAKSECACNGGCSCDGSCNGDCKCESDVESKEEKKKPTICVGVVGYGRPSMVDVLHALDSFRW